MVSKGFLIFLFLGLLVFYSLALYGEAEGYKYIKNYPPKEYDHVNQNWCVIQDKRGIIYVGNRAGLLEFDGVYWRAIKIHNNTVRSLALDLDGTVYIGGINEMGFLTADEEGQAKYVSLVSYLDQELKNFGPVWRSHTTAEGVYFRTSNFLFRWNNFSGQMTIWQAQTSFKASFTCRGKLYIHDRQVGLIEIVGDSLHVLPGSEAFIGKKIYLIAPYASHGLLIGTREQGFFLFDGIKAVPFPTEVDDYVKTNQIYHGCCLSGGNFALATLQGGLVIIDAQGKLKQVFAQPSGLHDDNVKYVYEDSAGNLWLALEKGVARIEYASPFCLYDQRLHLPGIVNALVRHREQLYVGTTRGLFYQGAKGGFEPMPLVNSDCWNLLSTGDTLWAATNQGVFRFKDNIRIRVMETPSRVLLGSFKDEHRIRVGTEKGLAVLIFQDGRWTRELVYKDINLPIRSIVEDGQGNLWLGTIAGQVIRIDFSRHGRRPLVTHFNTAHGLPAGELHVFWAAGHVMVASPDKGIFRFHEKNKTFVPDYTLGSEFAGGSRGVFRIVEGKDKNIWFHAISRNYQAIPQPDGTFRVNATPFLRVPIAQVNIIYPEADTVWFGGTDGLIRYTPGVKKNYRHDFPTLIRKVLVNGTRLVFAGMGSIPGTRPGDVLPIFPYRERSFSFEFAAPFFEEESAAEYRVFLEGYDKDWSSWTREARADYTNLDSGIYTFRVRAKNVYGHLGRESMFRFRVLSPWYKTWWAFLLYAFTFLLMVFLMVKWRSWKLHQEKRRLEQVVKDRTKEINEKNRQLLEQSEQLKELDKVKSRFFANISHEFRTPLTLITGPLEQLMADYPDKKLKKKVRLMLRNSQRLLHLINQLLDLSKFESGKMKLHACRQDIVPFIKGILASFRVLTQEYELELNFQAEEESITLYFDREKMENIIYNLVSNAVRFTPPGGKINLSVKAVSQPAGNFPCGYLELVVADTGIGIPESQLPYIFDRFYQAGDSYEHTNKGTGIGLALTKELVTLHHGEIEVKSTIGKGTVLITRLPLGDTHLEPGELAEPGAAPVQRQEPGTIPGLHVMEKMEEELEGEEKEDQEHEEQGEAAPGAELEPAREEKNIILVIDDSADMRSYIRSALEPGYLVEEAADGRVGMQKARDLVPDLIISDIIMPNVDGCELCRVLKGDIRTSHIPMILLTARAAEENVVQGLETGADDYITKPFNTRILMARIKNLIDLRRQLQLEVNRHMTLKPGKITVSAIDKEFMMELQKVINENLADPDFNVEDLGRKLYMSRATLYRKVMAMTGETPTDFIRTCRLKRAAQLLKKSSGSVSDVAFEVGFSSRTYFTKCFKNKFHQLPSSFQASESRSGGP